VSIQQKPALLLVKMLPFAFAVGIAERTLVHPGSLGYNRAMHSAGLWLSLAVLVGSALPPAGLSQGRTPSGPVGASMALLATLQEAGILPPEGTPTANRVIQSVIQFQGLFMKSTDPVVRQFLDQALGAKDPARAEELGAQFRNGGWSSQFIEALCDRYKLLSRDERGQLAASFARVNMRPEDFDLLCGLYARARSAFGEQGRDIHVVFAEHRKNMPGGKRFDRKERRDGDEGLHTDQGQNGQDQGRAAGAEKTRRRGTGPFVLRSA
jgi:hypothetical protein